MRNEYLTEAISKETGVSDRDVEAVIESFCRELHKRLYEYEGLNGDYVHEELLPHLGDFAWIHLYQFLMLHRMRYGSNCREDDISMADEMLERLGGRRRWSKFLHEARYWKQSSRFGEERSLYT